MHAHLSTAARRLAAALTYRDFRLLWFGALTSSIGTWMQKVAQAWLIVTLKDQPMSEEETESASSTVEKTRPVNIKKKKKI